MAKAKKTSSATRAEAQEIAAIISERYGVPKIGVEHRALRLIRRESEQGFGAGWWKHLLEAQFQTHIGQYKRIQCGQETHLTHLIPDQGHYCHDCGCETGEYHVFDCDSEECSNCGQQAFCCGCDDESPATRAQ